MFESQFGLCKREFCNKLRPWEKEGSTTPVDKRKGCFCELCHGPMCNSELLMGANTASQQILAVEIVVIGVVAWLLY